MFQPHGMSHMFSIELWGMKKDLKLLVLWGLVKTYNMFVSCHSP